MTEPLYTMAEAEQAIRDRDCALRQQHQLTAVPGDAGRVRCVSCTRLFLLVVDDAVA